MCKTINLNTHKVNMLIENHGKELKTDTLIHSDWISIATGIL